MCLLVLSGIAADDLFNKSHGRRLFLVVLEGTHQRVRQLRNDGFALLRRVSRPHTRVELTPDPRRKKSLRRLPRRDAQLPRRRRRALTCPGPQANPARARQSAAFAADCNSEYAQRRRGVWRRRRCSAGGESTWRRASGEATYTDGHDGWDLPETQRERRVQVPQRPCVVGVQRGDGGGVEEICAHKF